jgi:hypothetical protein
MKHINVTKSKPLATALDLKQTRDSFQTTVLMKCEKGHFEEVLALEIDWEEIDGMLSVDFLGSSSFDFCIGCEREEPLGARSENSKQSGINAVIASVERHITKEFHREAK